MSIVVKKIGGSLLKNEQDFERVAVYLGKIYQRQKRMIVVVSALKGETDHLIQQAKNFTSKACQAFTLFASLGEQKSCALLGLALESIKIPYHIFSGHNIHITKNNSGDYDVDKSVYLSAIQSGIVIVSGFIALTPDHQLITLGRGGSDLTALILAEYLQANSCELIKDVPGIFIPTEGSSKQFLTHINFEDLLYLAQNGAPIVQKDAIIFAQKHNLPFSVVDLAGNGTRVNRDAPPSLT